jgi:hypothetical protein
VYASYVTPDVIGGVPAADFGEETRVHELARRCAGGRAISYIQRCPWRVPHALVDRVTLEALGPGLASKPFSGVLGGLRHPIIERLAATSEPVASLSAYDRFRLEYRLSQGTILLADGVFEALR